MTLPAELSAETAKLLKEKMGVSDQEIEKILKGELVNLSVGTLTERELAAAFGVLVQKTPDEVEDIFIDNLGKEDSDESIQQLVAIEMGTDSDFSSLKLLPAKSAKDTVDMYVKLAGDLNLSPEESALFKALDRKTATAEQVEALLRQILANRLKMYKQSGLGGIAPYQRGKSEFQPGKELLERTQKLEILKKVSPEFVQYMIDYPKSKPTNGEINESFSWMNFNIEEKPTFSLVHKVTFKQDGLYLFFHRHFYVSRGHNSVQAAGGGLPLDESASATLLFFASRTSTDRVAGFGGAAKRALGSRIMGEKLAKNLTNLIKLNQG